MALTVHYRLPVSSRDGFKERTLCGAKSDSLSADVEAVNCRRCRGLAVFRDRLEWHRMRASERKKT